MQLKKVQTVLASHYDKVVAVLVLMALLGSLLYLGVQVGMLRSLQQQFEGELGSMKPARATARAVDVAPFEAAARQIHEPFQLATWTNAMFVPERRVICVDCRRPIPYDDAVCPFCDYTQPKDPEEREEFDGDKDGMWDGWELAHGLDPQNPRDAAEDPDGDGFSNLAEFLAKKDPNDAKSYPPPEAELSVSQVQADPFKLRFRGTQKLPDGSLKFQLNLRGNLRTYFVKMGDTAEGFKLVKYEPLTERRETGVGPRDIDVSRLTLQRGDNMITLIKDEDVQYNEYTVTMHFAIENREFTLKVDDEFDVKGKKYKLIGVDSKRRAVVIERQEDGKQMEVRPRAGIGDAPQAATGI